MKYSSILSILVCLLLLGGCRQNTNKENATADNSAQTESIETNKSKVFQKINPDEIKDNPITLFSKNWIVVTGGNKEGFNSMTVSWGELGNVWNQPTATVFIRDSRYTFGYLNKGKYFTLCAFDEEYRDKVKYIGSHSGKDVNKVEATGFTPMYTDSGSVYYKEARLVIECEKIYTTDIIPENLMDEKAKEIYKDGEGKHRMFFAKIINVWEKR